MMHDLQMSVMSALSNDSNPNLTAWVNFVEYIRTSDVWAGVTTPAAARGVVRKELVKYNATVETGVVTFATHEDKFQFMLTWG